MRHAFVGFLLSCTLLAIGSRPGRADPQLPAVFADRMVVQRESFIPVWGKAEPGEKITASLGQKTNAATADAKGRWLCALPPMKAGGPFTLTVAGKTTVTVRDVLVGEVWLCAGASNMAFDVQRANDAAKEIAAARFARLRLYNAAEPTRGWQPCSPDSVAGFSAAAYFFGRRLHRRLKVPVGLIESAVPRTPIAAWMSREALNAMPHFQRLLERMDRYNDEAASRRQQMRAWWPKAIAAALERDPGSRDDPPPWAAPGLKTEGDARWRPVELPRDPARRLADTWRLPRGVVWFRRIVEFPAALAGKELRLRLRFVDERKDAVYFDGRRLPKAPGGFRIPAGAAAPRRAVVAVRMVNLLGRGLTWLHTDKEGFALVAAGAKPLPLAGAWLTRTGVRAKAASLPSLPPPLPPRPSERTSPAALYPRMVRPLVPFGIRGVAWAQGEADVGRAAQYRELFPALIASWRKAWRKPKLPFLFVQLSGCARKRPTPGDDPWAELREAQASALRLPHTAMAVTLDIGHRATPPNKQEVGRRLALLARAKVYGEKIAAAGPACESSTVEGGKVRIRFRGAEGGLVAQGGDTSRLFAIAGADRRFVWADFKLEGATVLVWSRQVPQPAAVRYAWEHTPRFEHRRGEGWVTLGLLYGHNGLPVAPFRTDRWPGLGGRGR